MIQKSGDSNSFVATKGNTGFVLSSEPSEVHDGFDEDGVITYVGVFRVQLSEWTEEWTSAGNVHITDGPLKR